MTAKEIKISKEIVELLAKHQPTKDETVRILAFLLARVVKKGKGEG